MVKQKRIIMLEKTFLETLKIAELNTQNLRIKLIENLERLFLYAKEMASSPLIENREERVRICGYIAQTINSLANSFDEVRFNEQMEEIKEAFIKNPHISFMKVFSPSAPFGRKGEYKKEVTGISFEKLAHLIRRCGILAQTKVYLFWRKFGTSQRYS